MNDDIHDLSGAYALDALDDLERTRFSAHLDKCPTCQRDVADFRAAATHLGRAAAEVPPATLRAGVLAAVREVRQDRPITHVASRRRPSRWLMATASAAALVVVAVLAVALASARDDRDSSRQLAAVLAAPDAEVMQMHGDTGRGRIVWSPSLAQSVVVLSDLPDIPDHHTFQLWFVVDGRQIPGGVYEPHDHQVVATAGDMPAGVDAVGITQEPDAGSPQPTGPMLLTAEVPAGTV